MTELLVDAGVKVAEDSFRLLVEQVVDYAIFLLDPDGRVATWNAGAQRIKGYRADEIVGRHLSAFYRPEDVWKVEAKLDVARREGRVEDEGWRVRQDGTEFWANVVITPLRDARGELIGYAKVTRDLTERIRAEEAHREGEASKRVAALLTRINALTGALAAAITPEEVATILVAEGSVALRADAALVIVPSGERFEILAAQGASHALLSAFADLRHDARVPAATAYRTGTAQWLESAEQYTREAADFPADVPVAPSVAALPLIVGGNAVAVVALRFDEARTFPVEERALMETFAYQAGQALERARIYARERSTRHRVQALAELAADLSRAISVGDVANVVVVSGMREVGADTCTLYAVDDATQELVLIAEHGCSPAIVDLIRRIPPDPTHPVYGGTITRTAVWAETEVDYMARYPGLASMQVEGSRAKAFWSVPLVAENRVIGLVGMGFYAPRRFPADDRSFIETFTRHCAEALLRATRLETERSQRAIAEKLQASLSTTLRSIGDAVIATDVMGVITLMNSVAESLTGWTESEARGRPLSEVFHIVNEQTRATVASPAERVLAEGVVVGLANHTVLLARDGREIPIDDSGAPIRGGQGNAVEGVVLVFRDVSHKKREEARRTLLAEASAALVESLDYETTLANVARLAVPRLADWCAVDLVVEGEVRPKRLAVAHVDPAKIELAKEIDARYPPDPNAATGVPNVLRTGRSELYENIPKELLIAGCVDEEHLRIALALELRSAMVVPLRARGKVLGAMSFVFAESGRAYDREDLEVAEELARRSAFAIDNARLFASEQSARATADVANHAKDEFLAVVSHELRTPLNAILGWAKLMSGAGFDESRRGRAISTIERNAVAMAQLIEDLLDVSRIISGKMRLDVQRLDLSRVLDTAIESVRPSIDAKSIRFAIQRAEGVPVLLGDPARLQQVLWNLLSNAVKFTPSRGEVVVAVEPSPSSVMIRVTDSGRGIDPRFLPHVFEAFRQEDASFSRSRGGLGLGLAITRRLVELHGGEIEAESAGEGRGASFTVRLPTALAPRSPTPAATPRAMRIGYDLRFERPSELRGADVLVVDDEEDARLLMKAILDDCGCVVRLAGSADLALEAIASRVPDVVVSDIAMPERDGYELIRRVRALPASRGGEVPVAALTAYARAEDRNRMLEAGFSAHISKPLDPGELVTSLASLVESKPSR